MISKSDIEDFLAQFRENYVSCKLIRIGGEGDGGYLHPDNLEDISYCFSPGVSRVADFEKELSDRYDIKSFMADASVEQPPIDDENFEFIQRFLGSQTKDEFITLSDWMQETVGRTRDGMLLQMDIEGGEFDVLMHEDADTLAAFSTMIIEFHNLQKFSQCEFFETFKTVFSKIYENFSICHVHPNNCCGIAKVHDIPVPRVIEVTFIRNDLVARCSDESEIRLPHPLDRKNVARRPDITMPEVWWRKQ